MTDDQLVIRHVRICECGKPADHDSICKPGHTAAGLDPDDVQPIDADIAETYARRREERHAKRQDRFREERHRELANLSLLELCQRALAPTVESTVAAGNPEPSRGGSGESPAGPPRQQLPDDDPRIRLAKQQMRRAAEQLMRLRWEEHGWEATTATTTMLGEHKDTEILRCEGARPREVVGLLGPQVAGGSRTVERVREEAGRCRWCGQHWPSGQVGH